MFVEIAGLPGSGKSTLFRKAVGEMRRQGIAVTSLNEVVQKRSDEGWVPRFVRNKRDRALLYRFSRFLSLYPEMVRLADDLYAPEDVKHFLFTLLCAQYQTAHDLQRPGEVTFLEEGFLTHLVAGSSGAASDELFDKVVDAAPKLDAVIYLKVPTQTAYERVFLRRGLELHNSKVVMKLGDLEAFEERARLFERALKRYCQDATQLIEVDVTKSPQAAALFAVEELRALMGEANTPV